MKRNVETCEILVTSTHRQDNQTHSHMKIQIENPCQIKAFCLHFYSHVFRQNFSSLQISGQTPTVTQSHMTFWKPAGCWDRLRDLQGCGFLSGRLDEAWGSFDVRWSFAACLWTGCTQLHENLHNLQWFPNITTAFKAAVFIGDCDEQSAWSACPCMSVPPSCVSSAGVSLFGIMFHSGDVSGSWVQFIYFGSENLHKVHVSTLLCSEMFISFAFVGFSFLAT